jgi:NAD(P)-dependent dehydrogenase (short-subunit alcohol dehydrogenase family)
VLDRVKQQMNINLYAPMVLVQAFARVCTKGGSVVNMLDRRIVHDDVNYMSYSISKKALAAATRLAALELAPYVTVNAVAPGAVLSPHGSDPSVSPVPAGKVPMQSPCTPEDVANAVLFLLSQGLITGQTVYVDGGQHLLGNDVDG